MIDLSRVNWLKSVYWSLRFNSSANPFRTLYRLFFYHSGIFVFPGASVNIRGGSISIGKRLYLGAVDSLESYRSSELLMRENSVLTARDFRLMPGFSIHIGRGAKLTLGSGYANYNTEIYCFENIYIGNNVALSHHVMIRDSDNHHLTGQGEKTKPVRIGDHVWIGTNATILKGINIGNDSVVAAGAVVVNDVPPHTLVGGIPARVIRTNIKWH